MLLLPVCGQIFVKQPLPARKYQPVETPGGPEDEDEGDDPQGLPSEQPGVIGSPFSPLPPPGSVPFRILCSRYLETPVETSGGTEDEDEGDDPQGLHSEQDGEGS